MWVILTSLFTGLVGILGTRVGLRHLPAARGYDVHVYWSLGLLALLPAWLVAFVTLLPRTPGPELQPQPVAEVVWIASAATALLGAIVTESRLRHAAESNHGSPPESSSRLGVAAFIPSWAIALLGHALT